MSRHLLRTRPGLRSLLARELYGLCPGKKLRNVSPRFVAIEDRGVVREEGVDEERGVDGCNEGIGNNREVSNDIQLDGNLSSSSSSVSSPLSSHCENSREKDISFLSRISEGNHFLLFPVEGGKVDTEKTKTSATQGKAETEVKVTEWSELKRILHEDVDWDGLLEEKENNSGSSGTSGGKIRLGLDIRVESGALLWEHSRVREMVRKVITENYNNYIELISDDTVCFYQDSCIFVEISADNKMVVTLRKNGYVTPRPWLWEGVCSGRSSANAAFTSGKSATQHIPSYDIAKMLGGGIDGSYGGSSSSSSSPNSPNRDSSSNHSSSDSSASSKSRISAGSASAPSASAPSASAPSASAPSASVSVILNNHWNFREDLNPLFAAAGVETAKKSLEQAPVIWDPFCSSGGIFATELMGRGLPIMRESRGGVRDVMAGSRGTEGSDDDVEGCEKHESDAAEKNPAFSMLLSSERKENLKRANIHLNLFSNYYKGLITVNHLKAFHVQESRREPHQLPPASLLYQTPNLSLNLSLHHSTPQKLAPFLPPGTVILTHLSHLPPGFSSVSRFNKEEYHLHNERLEKFGYLLENHPWGDVYVLAPAKLRIKLATNLGWEELCWWTENGGRRMKLWKREGKIKMGDVVGEGDVMGNVMRNGEMGNWNVGENVVAKNIGNMGRKGGLKREMLTMKEQYSTADPDDW